MANVILYLITVLIWGSTWFAIEFQIGVAENEVSVAYRFIIASVMMWGICWWKKLPMRMSFKNHYYVLLLAVCNFSLNYLVLYWAQEYLTSAMSSIAFSMLLLVNIVNTRLFFGKPIAPRIVFGALMGVSGIVVLFWDDLYQFDLSSTALMGLGLSLLGTLIASAGNMFSVRNSAQGVGILQGNAWGMLYASVGLIGYACLKGSSFNVPMTATYLGSLFYLSVFGTVIAFACYFALFKNIGPEKASYVIVLFPLVAVTLSTLFEGFEWQINTVIGFSLVLLGNGLVLTPLDKIRRLYAGVKLSASSLPLR